MKNLRKRNGCDQGKESWNVVHSLAFIDHVFSWANGKNEKATLWHRRLIHLSESGMRILKSKYALTDMYDAILGFCKDCLYGK